MKVGNGWSLVCKGYWYLEPNFSRIYITRHVIFYETVFPFQSSLISSFVPSQTSFQAFCTPIVLVSLLFVTTPKFVASLDLAPLEQSHALKKSTSSTSPIPSIILIPFTKPTTTIDSSNTQHINHHLMITHAKVSIFKKNVFLAQKPLKNRTCKQVVKDLNQQPAMEIEYNTLMKNTLHVVPSPWHGYIICCKWVYKRKYKHNGNNINRYKAPLDANRFHQTHSIILFSRLLFPLDGWSNNLMFKIYFSMVTLKNRCLWPNLLVLLANNFLLILLVK